MRHLGPPRMLSAPTHPRSPQAPHLYTIAPVPTSTRPPARTTTRQSYEDMHDLFDEADVDDHHLMSRDAFVELVVGYAESHMVEHHD